MMMRVHQAAVLLALSVFGAVTCFTVTPQIRSASTTLRIHQTDLSEFEEFLTEGGATTYQPSNSRRQVRLGDSKTILASSFPGAAPIAEQQQQTDDPYAVDSQPLGKISQYQEQAQQSTLESKFKRMDLQDIILTLVIPGILAFAGGRWVFNRVNSRVSDNKEESLDNFARELIYHDGDLAEMELCVKDYKNRMVWMGPNRDTALLKAYLKSYAKKKPVSPQAIASLSYVFSLFKLNEEKGAKLLVSLCREMGADKISSAGKLLFFGSRILTSPEGQAGLVPIKDLIMSTYRDEEVAETLVETSQQAIAEAAYRTAVLGAGKNQSKLTNGWKVLGLSKETAQRIFQDEQKEGFVTDRETMYGGQTRKYDRQGRQIDDGGGLVNPEEADQDDDDEPETTSNVYECGNCGYTLFVATGRESKFFGDNFKCPECGAAKSEFQGRDIEE